MDADTPITGSQSGIRLCLTFHGSRWNLDEYLGVGASQSGIRLCLTFHGVSLAF